MARHSREFENQARRQLPIVVVRNLSLEEALGRDYLQHVEGRVRSDPATRTTEDVAFDDGRVLAWYVGGTTGYQLLTLYPAPTRPTRTRFPPEVERYLAAVWDTDVRGAVAVSVAQSHLALTAAAHDVRDALGRMLKDPLVSPLEWRELLNVQTWSPEDVASDAESLLDWLSPR